MSKARLLKTLAAGGTKTLANQLVEKTLKSKRNGLKAKAKNGLKNLVRNGDSNGNGHSNGNGIQSARDKHVAQASFTTKTFLGPNPTESQLVTKPEVIASNRQEAILRYNTRHWTTPEGKNQQVRNYGSKQRPLGGTFDRGVRKASRPGESPQRLENINESTYGTRDFTDTTIPGKQGHHIHGIDHWAWLFKGLKQDDKNFLHQMLWEKHGIVVGDKSVNRADISKIVHDLLHDTFRTGGLLPPKGNFSKLSLEERLVYLPQFLEDQQVMNEILMELQKLYNAGELKNYG